MNEQDKRMMTKTWKIGLWRRGETGRKESGYHVGNVDVTHVQQVSITLLCHHQALTMKPTLRMATMDTVCWTAL